MRRREFIAQTSLAAGSLLLPSCRRFSTRTIPGRILGASAAAGHRLRFGPLPEPTEEISVEAVVLGGGIAGLSAARKLIQRGVSDLLLLELESSTGGNALSGHNEISAYPWGAHYLPLPNEESVEVIALLEELGLITGRSSEGRPLFDEFALCADPMERLFVNGLWQEGFVPHLDVAEPDRRQIAAFLDRMDHIRQTRGSDGRRAFAIPLDQSSSDSAWRALDQITMSEYLAREKWTAEPLRWYVDYCCRDDYGAGSDHVSAWAGVHYFASRNGQAANAANSAVLTWPEGNGWLAKKLAEPLGSKIKTQSLVWKIETNESEVIVTYLDLTRERSVRVRAQAAICALPRFVANHLIAGRGPPSTPPALNYSPWMVANISLARIPGAPGSAPAWDNVLRNSRSLGYVNATHQSVSMRPLQTVLTYYQPLDDLAPPQAREVALARSHESWCAQIISDLERAHPQIRDDIGQIDVWLWGHAMIRPVPGFIWGETRQAMLKPLGRLTFAHSDMSGLSIFEEAYTRGVNAAAVVFKQLRQLS